MSETRCPNCGRKLTQRTTAQKNVRCPKCGETLRFVARSAPSQGWEKLAGLLEGGGLAPLGSSPAALTAEVNKPQAIPSPAAGPSRNEVTGTDEKTENVRQGRENPSPSREMQIIGEGFMAVREDLGRIEERLAALEALLKKK
ncbi:MAG TPA: hypothetical protein VJ955_04330 [Desulfuromonadales bacterium]|nr:hypothetical protein [Desulfuromonadales bacterium]